MKSIICLQTRPRPAPSRRSSCVVGKRNEKNRKEKKGFTGTLAVPSKVPFHVFVLILTETSRLGRSSQPAAAVRHRSKERPSSRHATQSFLLERRGLSCDALLLLFFPPLASASFALGAVNPAPLVMAQAWRRRRGDHVGLSRQAYSGARAPTLFPSMVPSW